MRRTLITVAMAAGFLVGGGASAAPPPSDSAFTFRLGGFFPSGDSDFWHANEAAFTLDHSDFNGLMGGVGYSMAFNNWFEFDLNADFYWQATTSADQYYVDQDGYPIFHDSRLSLIPLTAGVRVLPAGRYHQRGSKDNPRYARHPVPYIGAGLGAVYWQYEEEGDFVASDLSVVYDRLKDSGFDLETHAYAGIEFPVAHQWNVTLEARHSWIEVTPGGDFAYVNPGKFDLGGWSLYVGGALRF